MALGLLSPTPKCRVFEECVSEPQALAARSRYETPTLGYCSGFVLRAMPSADEVHPLGIVGRRAPGQSVEVDGARVEHRVVVACADGYSRCAAILIRRSHHQPGAIDVERNGSAEGIIPASVTGFESSHGLKVRLYSRIECDHTRVLGG